MAKYTKLVAQKIYDLDVEVFFRETYGLRGIFRDITCPPYALEDIPKHQAKPFYSITFNCTLYEADCLSPHAWDTIIHEVTHYKIGITFNPKSKRFSHDKEFTLEERRNKAKVKDLKKLFDKESA